LRSSSFRIRTIDAVTHHAHAMPGCDKPADHGHHRRNIATKMGGHEQEIQSAAHDHDEVLPFAVIEDACLRTASTMHAHNARGFRARARHVAPRGLPDIDIGCDDERIECSRLTRAEYPSETNERSENIAYIRSRPKHCGSKGFAVNFSVGNSIASAIPSSILPCPRPLPSIPPSSAAKLVTRSPHRPPP
jgi:hypothetical protein